MTTTIASTAIPVHSIQMGDKTKSHAHAIMPETLRRVKIRVEVAAISAVTM
jgi:hypothetical protein